MAPFDTDEKLKAIEDSAEKKIAQVQVAHTKELRRVYDKLDVITNNVSSLTTKVAVVDQKLDSMVTRNQLELTTRSNELRDWARETIVNCVNQSLVQHRESCKLSKEAPYKIEATTRTTSDSPKAYLKNLTKTNVALVGAIIALTAVITGLLVFLK